MIDNDNPCVDLCHPLCFLDQLDRIAYDADHMRDENMVERVVGKRQLEGVGLENTGMGEIALSDFFAGFAQHACGQVNSDNFALVRVKMQTASSADAQIKHPVGVADVH